ncbi:Rpb7-binding protein seb1 [Daldinia childiae]|uniref:Rpb7-binding protein seb1 n=1 Tax=Daldinia childiae TaxID=326645 RepID=UPI001444B86A|nr:Rpb7-binding protein seb1 [Daldinia childiae]KAF3070550.1 Rpb7-binding protein seb1 [Daldinia childiae]
MSSPVTELEAGLNAMQNLKPPGVTQSRIVALTSLCVDNVQSESVLIQKIYTHFKKAPATHKLGVLYVVDSVTRKWVDQAKHQGQPINSSAKDGTYAAGVHRVTELLPVLMNDIFQNAPGEQKDKIKKLIDIWEKGQTFPRPMIESFKEKMKSFAAKDESTTPVGSPPPGPGLPGLTENKPHAVEAPNAIMEALANIARQNVTATPTNNNNVQAPASAYSVPPAQTSAAQPPILPLTQSQPPVSYSAPPQQPVNLPGMYPFPQPGQVQTQAHTPVPQVNASNQAAGFPGVASAVPAAPTPGMDPSVQQQVMLIKLLADQGVPFDKIPAIIASMQSNSISTPPAANPAAVPPVGQPPYAGLWGQGGFRPEESRDHEFQQVRSPNRYRNRSRSRSPQRHWDARDSPRGRSDREYGSYGRNSPGLGRTGGTGYRQRSPGRRGRSPSPAHGFPQPTAKWVEFDRTIPQGHIKVLSRTLFVGGVTCPESELRSVFNRHGQVQTCIVNKDKRHAFVKMVTRRDAVTAKEAMESSTFRTRWGVGFGPRDCSDYQTGISVIPISKLTEADRKWMLTAEYGGSGGRAIESGMVVEEPDIEIGAGVSSKAISRRMQTDKGGRHGPKSSRGPGDSDEGDLTRWRRNRDPRQEDVQSDMNGLTTGPAVPAFPFGIGTGPNGMPVFPPGFAFPAPPADQ